MKRRVYLTITGCLIIAMLFSGCGRTDTDSPQLPNPIVEYNDSSAFEKLGIMIDAPDNATDVIYSIISNEIAQITFKLNNKGYSYRAAKTNDDISGVYGTFDEPVKVMASANGEAIEITVKSLKEGSGVLAIWKSGSVQYSLYTPDNATTDDAGNLA